MSFQGEVTRALQFTSAPPELRAGGRGVSKCAETTLGQDTRLTAWKEGL